MREEDNRKSCKNVQANLAQNKWTSGMKSKKKMKMGLAQ